MKPIGARQWQPSHDVVREDPNGGELASLDADFIIAGEGRDEMAVDEDFVQFLDDI